MSLMIEMILLNFAQHNLYFCEFFRPTMREEAQNVHLMDCIFYFFR